ncbi:DUF1206 domain-containing protein [Allosphingosinicella sp.]|uniref:DUF1206 domain-containing protein n=1 Tax=Allosphingosinicella sp. TaxID=2823234 RepID=UPI002EF47DB5
MAGTGAFEILTRIGFAARGLVYAMVGWLALRNGRSEDPGGIFDYLETGIGPVLLAAMALGFLAYALWRLLDAWIDPGGRGSDAKGVGVRLAGAGSGLVHLGFAGAAALHLVDTRGGGGGSSGEEGARAALSLPGGTAMLYAVAAILLGMAVAQFAKAWKMKFMRNLDVGGTTGLWVCWLGRLGFATRGAVFAVIATLFWSAASHSSASEAGGLGDALRSMSPTLKTAVAFGLILFGLFSLAEGRYRRIDRRLSDAVPGG